MEKMSPAFFEKQKKDPQMEIKSPPILEWRNIDLQF